MANSGQFKKGHKTWNKGKRGFQVGYWKGKKRPSPTEETKQKMRNARAKQIMTPEHCKKIAKSRMGEKNWMWKGGATPLNKKIRMSAEYKLWRGSVFKRDNYQCIWGGKAHGYKLHADHIKPFSLFPELRFAIDNGRTLCRECHKKTDTYGKKRKKIT